jgi:hypothetical protein
MVVVFSRFLSFYVIFLLSWKPPPACEWTFGSVCELSRTRYDGVWQYLHDQSSSTTRKENENAELLQGTWYPCNCSECCRWTVSTCTFYWRLYYTSITFTGSIVKHSGLCCCWLLCSSTPNHFLLNELSHMIEISFSVSFKKLANRDVDLLNCQKMIYVCQNSVWKWLGRLWRNKGNKRCSFVNHLISVNKGGAYIAPVYTHRFNKMKFICHSRSHRPHLLQCFDGLCLLFSQILHIHQSQLMNSFFPHFLFMGLLKLFYTLPDA